MIKNERPPLWPSGQIQRNGFDSRSTRFSGKLWVWNGVHSVSWAQLRSYLEEKVVAPV
jgi:hypothetical protein